MCSQDNRLSHKWAFSPIGLLVLRNDEPLEQWHGTQKVHINMMEMFFRVLVINKRIEQSEILYLMMALEEKLQVITIQ